MESELSGKIGTRTGSDFGQKRRARAQLLPTLGSFIGRGKKWSSVRGQHGWSTEAVSVCLCLSVSLCHLSLSHIPELVLKGLGLGMQLNWKSTCLACTKPWVPSQRCQLGVQCQHLGGKGRRSTSLRSASKKEENTKPRSHPWLYSAFRPTEPQREAEYTYGRVKISRAQDQVGSKVMRSG